MIRVTGPIRSRYTFTDMAATRETQLLSMKSTVYFLAKEIDKLLLRERKEAESGDVDCVLREENEMLRMQLQSFQRDEMDRLARNRTPTEALQRKEILRLTARVNCLTRENLMLNGGHGRVECDEVDGCDH